MIPVTPENLHENADYVIIGHGQKDHIELPASMSPDGMVMTEWALTQEELAKLVLGGRIRLWIHTMNNPFQPVRLEVTDFNYQRKES